MTIWSIPTERTGETLYSVRNSFHNDTYVYICVAAYLVFIEDIFGAQLDKLVVAKEEQEQDGEKELKYHSLSISGGHKD